MNTPPKMILVPVDLLQTTANYLATRPYREVAGLIQAIQTCKPVDDQKPTEGLNNDG